MLFMRNLLMSFVVLACLGQAAGAEERRLELLFFERAGCPWCARFEREVGPIYPKTSAGQAAPLRKVNLDDRAPLEHVLSAPILFTPTFVLIDRGKEIGRITGFINDATFWGLLESMLSQPAKE